MRLCATCSCLSILQETKTEQGYLHNLHSNFSKTQDPCVCLVSEFVTIVVNSCRSRVLWRPPPPPLIFRTSRFKMHAILRNLCPPPQKFFLWLVLPLLVILSTVYQCVMVTLGYISLGFSWLPWTRRLPHLNCTSSTTASTMNSAIVSTEFYKLTNYNLPIMFVVATVMIIFPSSIIIEMCRDVRSYM